MDATTAAVATGIVVVAGEWTSGKGLTARAVIGSGIYCIILSVMDQSQPQFAGTFAALILVTACLLYVLPITKALGYPVGTTGGNKPTYSNGGA
jgi:hypothetical protein